MTCVFHFYITERLKKFKVRLAGSAVILLDKPQAETRLPRGGRRSSASSFEARKGMGMTTASLRISSLVSRSNLSRILAAVGLLVAAGPVFGQPSVVGSWAAPVNLQAKGAHGAVLPNGKVLWVRHRFNSDGTTPSVVLDPSNPSGANYARSMPPARCPPPAPAAAGRPIATSWSIQVEA